jgi:integrase
MVGVLLLTGMRINELCLLRPQDVDSSGVVWQARLSQHKTAAKTGQRVVPLGPKAQLAMGPHLASARPGVDPVFRNSRRRKWRPDAFRKSLAAACERASVPAWTTHQLWHTAASLARTHAGLYAARAMLGHSSVTTTTNHAEAEGLAMKLEAEIG